MIYSTSKTCTLPLKLQNHVLLVGLRDGYKLWPLLAVCIIVCGWKWWTLIEHKFFYHEIWFLQFLLNRRSYLVPIHSVITNFVPTILVWLLSNYWPDNINSNAIFEISVFSGKIVYRTCFYFLWIMSEWQ